MFTTRLLFPTLAAALVFPAGCDAPPNTEANAAKSADAATTPAALPEVRYYVLSAG